jgi:hypothetical protein
MVLSLHVYDESHIVMPSKDASDEAEEYDSADSEKEKDVTTSPSEVWKEDKVCINPTKCPNLFKVIPKKSSKCYITALFSEMHKILGEGNSIDFVYGTDRATVQSQLHK